MIYASVSAFGVFFVGPIALARVLVSAERLRVGIGLGEVVLVMLVLVVSLTALVSAAPNQPAEVSIFLAYAPLTYSLALAGSIVQREKH